jgi:hypothetical protein
MVETEMKTSLEGRHGSDVDMRWVIEQGCHKKIIKKRIKG